jgi:tRNA-specific 2-thiouridylase
LREIINKRGINLMSRAIAMISGGLDSILAAKLIKEQGIEVIGICFTSHFFGADNAIRMANQIGIELKVIDFSEAHFSMVKNPKHGYGKNVNPCVDCHAMMMNYSGHLLEKLDADFIITGEVLNQRPMSQNRSALDVVKNESGFKDKILRPLCAKNLNVTKMESEGLVDRERLLDIKGRSRKSQIELAKTWGIVDYPSPAGGCKLTEPNYGKRLKELMEYKEEITSIDLEMLKIGRHFRVTKEAKIISTRDESEAKDIKSFLSEKDMVFLTKDFNGSLVVIVGDATTEDIEFAAKIAARYSKGMNEKIITVVYNYFKEDHKRYIDVKPANEDETNKYILN